MKISINTSVRPKDQESFDLFCQEVSEHSAKIGILILDVSWSDKDGRGLLKVDAIGHPKALAALEDGLRNAFEVKGGVMDPDTFDQVSAVTH